MHSNKSVKESNTNAMDCNSYSELMHLWGIDRIDSKRGFSWKVIFDRFFSKFHYDKLVVNSLISRFNQ
ncbi:unnamed protein product [Brugia pahangi]|uniref:Uncharacterized protein n=1 Tax=Brugia pahangi TaxID=6280 RepID=A0A0N4TA99_BRUPA|nr:unnamed protein product [Brugia pahangi]